MRPTLLELAWDSDISPARIAVKAVDRGTNEYTIAVRSRVVVVSDRVRRCIEITFELQIRLEILAYSVLYFGRYSVDILEGCVLDFSIVGRILLERLPTPLATYLGPFNQDTAVLQCSDNRIQIDARELRQDAPLCQEELDRKLWNSFAQVAERVLVPFYSIKWHRRAHSVI